jgi:Fe-S-cluster containining protein
VHLPIPEDLQNAFDRERKDARARRAADSPQARAQTVRMYGRLAALQSGVIVRERIRVECERGCSYCCHLRVEIRPHEAFVLAHHVQTKLGAEARARALARIERNLAQIAELAPQAHVRAGIPCALLEDGACSVYEARPAACRKYYSMSRSVCRDAFNDTSAPLTGEIESETVRLAGNAVALGYAKGLEDAGYDTTLYELHFALNRALADPKAEKRYRSRKRPFV